MIIDNPIKTCIVVDQCTSQISAFFSCQTIFPSHILMNRLLELLMLVGIVYKYMYCYDECIF